MKNLTLVVTPKGIRCPLGCDYCYNADPLLPRSTSSPSMSLDTLDTLLRSFMQYPQGKYEIIWHGGEPTLAGIAFYEHVLQTQRQLVTELSLSAPVENHIQTSGVLITEEWAKFFRANKFKVGISIDGPQDIHNTHRKYPNGRGSFEDAMRGALILKKAGVSLGVGAVVTKKMLDEPIRVFDFMRKRFRIFDFSPCFTAISTGGIWTQEVTPADYARFVKTVFDYWFELDDPAIRIRSFRHYVAAALGHTPKICSMANGCHKYLSVDSIGKVYPCGRLHGIPTLCFGSIQDQTFEQILQRPDYLAYQVQAHSLADDCNTCEWKFACNNGCTAARYTETGVILTKTPFCEATKEILEHVSHKVAQTNS